MNISGYRKTGFSRGLRWLPAAAELLFSAFTPLSGLAALWLLVSMIALIPVVGQLSIMLITPLLTAGAIAAYAEVAAGRRPAPTILFSAWSNPDTRRRLLGVGAFGILGSLVAMATLAAWLGSQVSPEQLQVAQTSPEAMAEVIRQVSPGPLLLVAAAVLAVVLSAMYFAVPLLLFSDLGVVAALTLSLRAVIGNWAAFLAFGLVLIIAVIALGIVFGVILVTLGIAIGPAGQMAGQVLVMLAAMLVQVLMAGTQWIAFTEVFGKPGDRQREADPSDQLLA